MINSEKLERFNENKDFAIFDELRLLNDLIKDLIEAVGSSKSEVVSVSNLSDAIVDLSPLEDNFDGLKESVESVTEAIKAIPTTKEVNLSGIVKLLEQITNKEVNLSELTKITGVLDNILGAFNEMKNKPTDNKWLTDILNTINENIASIEFPDFDYEKLAKAIKENVNIKVSGGGPGSVFIKDVTSGNPISPATETTLADFLFNYKLSDIDDSTTTYLGYLKKDGAWYIQKITSAGAVTYAAGASGYNFANRASETYNIFSTTF